jgi:hypothetical protein
MWEYAKAGNRHARRPSTDSEKEELTSIILDDTPTLHLFSRREDDGETQAIVAISHFIDYLLRVE